MKRLCVFCGSKSGSKPFYTEATKRVSQGRRWSRMAMTWSSAPDTSD